MADKTEGLNRRGFLSAFGLGAGVAAAGAAGVAATVAPAAAQEKDDEKVKARYKVTDHVKAFYRVNRY